MYYTPIISTPLCFINSFSILLERASKQQSLVGMAAMNLQEYLEVCPHHVVEHIRTFQMCLGFYFDDMNQAREAADILWKVPCDEETFIGIWDYRRLNQGLVFVRLARETGKCEYRKR
jgi:hypothetical protein